MHLLYKLMTTSELAALEQTVINIALKMPQRDHTRDQVVRFQDEAVCQVCKLVVASVDPWEVQKGLLKQEHILGQFHLFQNRM